MPAGAVTALSERQKAILFAVVREHIETAQPVASRSTARRSGLRLSPASVRTAMAELSERGYLSQPHVSAGRVPTDQAYRLYVDALLGGPPSRLSDPEGESLLDLPGEGDLSGELELMQHAADLLSRVTGQVGFYLGRPAEETVLERLQFTRVSGERVLALLVSRTRVIQTRLIEDSDCDARMLEKVSAGLSEIVCGLTLSEARARLASTIELERAASDELRRKIFVLGWEGLARAAEAEWYLGDRQALLRQPEFADVARLRELLVALEEKERMVRLLDQLLQARAIVAIGSELADPGVRSCSLVALPLGASPYGGGLGVIGPVRMPYDRVISAVRYVSERVSHHL